MNPIKNQNPEYGNWVTKKLILIPGTLGVVFLALSLAAPILLFVSLLFFLALAYFAYARWQFSPNGGDIQARIRNLVLERLDWNGRGQALDIGCGNGPLAIELAKRLPKAGAIGIDPWGTMWEYSRTQCEENAEREGVASRVTFQKAGASHLPFPDGAFDAVVSNFVFHEVRDAIDKRPLILEALRVLRKGGAFSFQDMFFTRQMYGSPEELLERIRSNGVELASLERTSGHGFIPRWLKLPFMVGDAGILFGRK